jgi:DNA-binding NarL/FixJ family response regulator
MHFFIHVDNLFIREGIRSILNQKYAESNIVCIENILELETEPIENSSIYISNSIQNLCENSAEFEELIKKNKLKTILIVNSAQIDSMFSIEIEFIDAIVYTNCSLTELNEALGYIQAGLQYRCKKMNQNSMSIDSFKSFLLAKDVSNREMEIIQQIIIGKSSKEIADSLFISYHTVTTHRKNINKKLNVKNPQDLIRIKMELNDDTLSI